MRLVFAFVAVVCASLFLTAGASATPVATNEGEYEAMGAVFPDPLAVCQGACDPNSRGHTSATQFIQYQEFVNALEFMNTNKDWKRYMEVWPLDGHLGDGAGTKAGDDMAPGNNIGDLEWTPKKEYQSAGLPKTDGTRQKSDLIVVRVTDENVPDKDKKRYALSLSIHGIERAGAEGGIRAMEQIVTAVAEGRGDDPILPKAVRAGAPTYREVLANSIIYFTLPNPDGWRRGSIADTAKGPGVFFQRYNGNGVDPNRDWPDIGYTFRGYSGASEPETRAFTAFYHEIRDKFGDWAAGDDLHGQPFADALSFTLLPHGRHDIDEDYKTREASKLINRAQYNATKWNPMIIDNDVENQQCGPGTTVGTPCPQVYAQTWGSVYDTINYTTTGSLGDWFDSALGLGATGIDNEMSFSHLDKNINFDPNTEQLHVAANKAIIFAHLSDMLRPPGTSWSTPGKNAFVPNRRLKRDEKQIQPGAPEGTTPQEDKDDELPTGPTEDGTEYVFEVKRSDKTFDGGMRVDVRASNVQGIGSGVATLKVECLGCDDHVGVQEDDGYVTVAEDYNQGIGYAQAGLTAAVNRPDAFTSDGKPVTWRARVSAPGGIPRYSIDFTSGPATTDGATGGDDPPRLAAYDVANTDFFGDLNEDAKADDDKFASVDPTKVVSGEQSLDGYDTLVLADAATPGYNGLYKDEVRPTGPPTKDFTFQHSTPTTPGGGVDCERPGATEVVPFTIGDDDAVFQANIEIHWSVPASDYDLYLYKDENGNGAVDDTDPQAASPSAGSPPATSEQITMSRPDPGDYLIEVANCNTSSEADPWSGSAKFTGFPPPPANTVSASEKDAWMGKLRDWVSAGGNLVLTDEAIRALGELSNVPGSAVRTRTVYVGQTSFQICSKFEADGTTCAETKETFDDPLAANVMQPAARFNTGLRRQTYEPTPIGYAIQNDAGADQSFARQTDVLLQDFLNGGGRPAGGSADSGARDAQAVPTRVTLGEIPVGKGHIRILSGLLPQPSEDFDHPLGLSPYSVTYTGYILFCNLVNCTYEPRARPALPNPPAPPGPVKLGFGVKLRAALLASKPSRNGKRVPLRIRATGIKAIDHLVLQYRKTGRGTKNSYRRLKPHLRARTRKVIFKKGRVGETYLFRIRAVGKTGVKTDWTHRRVVFPYDDSGKRRHYSPGWKKVKSKRSWRGGYHQSSRRGATLTFTTKGGGRVYLIAHTSRKGGKALVQARGGKKRVVSFRTKKARNRRVVTVINRTDKRKVRVKVKVLRGQVTVDGIGVRRR